MIKRAIIDTGPLVAFLDRDEKYHGWTVKQVHNLEAPLLICEAVLTETMFLLRRTPSARNVVFDLLANGALALNFSLRENATAVQRLLKKYLDSGISVADACLIRMSELNSDHAVFTLDSDFIVYRRHGREPIKLIAPSAK